MAITDNKRQSGKFHSADWYSSQEAWEELEANADRNGELGFMLALCAVSAIGMCVLIWAAGL